MLRVTKAEGRSRTIITVEGQLLSDYVEVVETCCDQARSKGKCVHVFLRDVATIDEAGRTLLSRLAAKGVRLLGRGVSTSYLIRALDPAGSQPVDSSVAGGRFNDRAAERKP